MKTKRKPENTGNKQVHASGDILLSLDADALTEQLCRVKAEERALKILLRASLARDEGKTSSSHRTNGGRDA